MIEDCKIRSAMKKKKMMFLVKKDRVVKRNKVGAYSHNGQVKNVSHCHRMLWHQSTSKIIINIDERKSNQVLLNITILNRKIFIKMTYRYLIFNLPQKLHEPQKSGSCQRIQHNLNALSLNASPGILCWPPSREGVLGQTDFWKSL